MIDPKTEPTKNDAAVTAEQAGEIAKRFLAQRGWKEMKEGERLFYQSPKTKNWHNFHLAFAMALENEGVSAT